MLKKLTLMSVVGMLCLVLKAQNNEIKPLSIGDAVPDIIFNHVINYKDTTARLSDFRGKLVILDFWATWCRACVNEMPKLNRLQKKFSQFLSIILVNNEARKSYELDKANILNFYDKVQKSSTSSFLLPTNLERNSFLDTLFPHRFIPHCVWISPEGKVIAITSAQEVSDENIWKIMNSDLITLPLKEDTL